MKLTRRNFIGGLLTAPALVRASSLDFVPRAWRHDEGPLLFVDEFTKSDPHLIAATAAFLMRCDVSPGLPNSKEMALERAIDLHSRGWSMRWHEPVTRAYVEEFRQMLETRRIS